MMRGPAGLDLLGLPRVRILHISTRLILGGSQENTVLSCEGQARLGHDLHLAFGPIYGPEGSLLARVQSFSHGASRIRTHEMPSLLRDVSPRADARCLHELRELILRLKPHIVHTHSSKAGILGRVAAWQVRKSVLAAAGHVMGIVHTIHGPPFMPVEGSALERSKIALSNALYTLAEYTAAHHCHAIVSVADAMTQQYLARGIGEASLYTTVRSGMEVQDYLHARPQEDRDAMRRALGLSANDFAIGTVARLAQHKGHDDLLSILPLLKARGAQRGVRPVLLWVGDGWLREQLLARASAMGLCVRDASDMQHAPGAGHADIILTGLVAPSRVPACIRAMDVLAHPSSREGLPRTVPQALLAGVCPVAYDVDGTREACIEMKTGRLVAHADTRGLADALLWCMHNREAAAKLAHAGQAWARHEFAAETMVQRLERVYERAFALARDESL